VVEHEGCGTVDPDTFQAFLESENGERVKVDFTYETSYTDGQRWKLVDYDPKTQFQQGSQGRFFLDVSADESGFCFVYLPVFSFKVAEFIGPPFFAQVPGTGPAIFHPPYTGSVVFHSALHDNGDEDYFTVKATGAPNGTFGSWFNITVSSVNPCDCKVPCDDCEDPSECKAPCDCVDPCDCKDPSDCYTFALKLLSPKNSNLIESKSSRSTLWIGLKNGVSTKFRVSGADVFPVNSSLESYKVIITQTSIPDQHEPDNDIAWTCDTENPGDCTGTCELDSTGKCPEACDPREVGTCCCPQNTNQPGKRKIVATELKKGVPSTNYMANVLDAEDNVVGGTDGGTDWFWINHRYCVVDCIKLSKTDTRPYFMDYCLAGGNPDYPGLCDGGTKEDQLCQSIDKEFNEKGDGPRYLKVTVDCRGVNCNPYGDASTPPQHYKEPYAVTWSEQCQLAIDPQTKECGDEDSCTNINALKP